MTQVILYVASYLQESKEFPKLPLSRPKLELFSSHVSGKASGRRRRRRRRRRVEEAAAAGGRWLAAVSGRRWHEVAAAAGLPQVRSARKTQHCQLSPPAASCRERSAAGRRR